MNIQRLIRSQVKGKAAAGFLVFLLLIIYCRIVCADDVLGIHISDVSIVKGDPVRIKLLLSVFDSSGRAVTDLSSGSFQINEDGRSLGMPEDAIRLVTTGHRIAYSVLVDHSEDIMTSLTTVRHIVADIFVEMGFRNQGALISYTGTPTVLEQGAPQAIADAALKIQPVNAEPLLWDGLMTGVETLVKIAEWEPDYSGKAMIVLTEGRTESGLVSEEAVRAKILESGIILFVIGYGLDPEGDLAKLDAFARRTGGCLFTVDERNKTDLARIITERITNQYEVTYISETIDLDGGDHGVVVSAAGRKGRGEGTIEFSVPEEAAPRYDLKSIGLATAAILIVLLSILMISNRIRK